jgi:4-amino-4-deoxy-L-arabinose transferase-like glycosyltransferase
MIVTALVFSFMSGTIHPYYAAALAPSIAAVVAISGNELWRGRNNIVVRSILALMIAATGIWSFVLLGRDATWLPWLRWVVLIGSIVGAALLVASVARLRRLAVVGLLVGSLAALGGTTAYTLATAATPHSGSIPTSGPTGSAIGGFGSATAGGGFGGRGQRDGQEAPTGAADGTAPQGIGTPPDGAPTGTDGTAQGGIGTMPDGTATARGGTGTDGAPAGGAVPGGAQGAIGGAPGGGIGGNSTVTNTELINMLNATDSRWSAAVSGSQTAAGYILATDTAVMAIGGWSGDPSPTLAQFQQYVANGDITYYIAGGGMGGGGGPRGQGGTSTSSEIQAWVEANFTASTVGGATVYNLTTSS